jgi:hypothetical protein
MKDYTGPGIPSIEDNPEGKNSELVNTYPIFDKIDLDGKEIYLERSPYSKIPEGEDRFRDEDARLFVMPSGPILLSSESLIHSEDLWNISEEDKEALRKIEEFVQEYKEETNLPLFQMGNQRNYRAEIFSYNDPTSVKRLNNLLEDKMRKRKAMNK